MSKTSSQPIWVIAGSDSSGGAGIQAATKTLTALATPVVNIVTAWTAQNSARVYAVETPALAFIQSQFEAAHAMGPPAAVVTGMLASRAILDVVADELLKVDAPIIVDPVLVSTSGADLLESQAVYSLLEKVIPRAEVVTPNLPELGRLTGLSVESTEDRLRAARMLLNRGAKHVWVKGGHDLRGKYSVDMFVEPDRTLWFGTPRIEGVGTHGTGCTLAAALSGAYAQGYRGIEAALFARMYLNRALRLSRTLPATDSENVFDHSTWPLDVAPADAPIVREMPFEEISDEKFAPLLRAPDFYPIVETIEQLEGFVRRGVRTIQLRAKTLDTALLRKHAARAQAVCTEHGAQFFLNDDWRLAIELGCYGVHLGQEDLLEADVGAIRRAGLRLGLSTHSFEELGRAKAARPSYVALGPIYPTRLKAMRFAPQGLAKLALWRQLTDVPLVAIGGITLDEADKVLRTGANGIAVVNDVLSHPEPLKRVDEWLRVF